MSLVFCIIDDESEVCDILRLFFESRGHRCVVAHDGPSGLANVRKHRPAAVFLDLAMPKMNGYEVLSEIRKDPTTAEIPVMMITGLTKNTTVSEKDWAQAAGANALLSKPFELDELLETVERVTGVAV